MENLKSLSLWLATPYAILIASLYSLSYWSSFNINIFEYTTASEMLLSSLAACLIVGIMILLLVVFALEDAARETHDGGGDQYVSARTLIVFSAFAYAFLVFISWLANFYWNLLFSLIVPLSALATLILKRKGFLKPWIVILATICFIVIPIFIFVGGKVASRNILDGAKYWSMTKDGEQWKLIGHAGERMFFVDDSGDKLLIIPDGGDQLSLKRITRLDSTSPNLARLKSLFNFKD